MKTYTKLSICVLLAVVLGMSFLTALAEENKETVYVIPWSARRSQWLLRSQKR